VGHLQTGEKAGQAQFCRLGEALLQAGSQAATLAEAGGQPIEWRKFMQMMEDLS
jgi:hypothetical protein